MDVEIRYFDGCPNWRDTDELVRRMVKELAVDAVVSHRLVETPEEAERLDFVGSPSVLVDGVDPFMEPGAAVGLSCRVYRTESGFAGSPSETQLRSAIEAASLPAVVFLCVHNAGRSQMAAGWARHLGGDRLRVFSGGSNPGAEVNPAAVAVMSEMGIDISGAAPQRWTDEIVRSADVVVTMGCGDECPFFSGVRYEDWALDDPAGLPVEQVRPIRDEIRSHVEDLLSRLGVVTV